MKHAAKSRRRKADTSRQRIVEAARALDDICAQADIQVAFHIVAAPGADFAGTKLRDDLQKQIPSFAALFEPAK